VRIDRSILSSRETELQKTIVEYVPRTFVAYFITILTPRSHASPRLTRIIRDIDMAGEKIRNALWPIDFGGLHGDGLKTGTYYGRRKTMRPSGIKGKALG
jgi:hypothetical protein